MAGYGVSPEGTHEGGAGFGWEKHGQPNEIRVEARDRGGMKGTFGGMLGFLLDPTVADSPFFGITNGRNIEANKSDHSVIFMIPRPLA